MPCKSATHLGNVELPTVRIFQPLAMEWHTRILAKIVSVKFLKVGRDLAKMEVIDRVQVHVLGMPRKHGFPHPEIHEDCVHASDCHLKAQK